MVVRVGDAVSYERGTSAAARPARALATPPRDACGGPLLMTEFIKEDSALLPDPCHLQNYDRPMFSPNQPIAHAINRCSSCTQYLVNARAATHGVWFWRLRFGFLSKELKSLPVSEFQTVCALRDPQASFRPYSENVLAIHT